jgi:CheY-like chemotaxis protein
MPKTKILLVDNDLDFLETRREFLEKEGYSVTTALSHIEAKERLDRENADLAVIDVRLLNDDDEKDNSGLELAKEASRSLPVIILTGYPSAQYMRQTLGPQLDGMQIAYDFLAKEDGPAALISSIRRTLEITKQGYSSLSRAFPIMQKHPQNSLIPDTRREQELPGNPVSVKLDVPEQMLKDYELARLHARWTGWAQLGLVVAGVLIFFFGIVTIILGYRDIGILGAITGAITGMLGGLLTKFASDSKRRWDQFHKELMLLHKNNTQRKEN